jgi:MFS transporter, OCT family, solute carrier family 22 (organic cation transporter), member 4/5
VRGSVGFAVSGIGVVAFTLACELVGSSWRGTLGIVCQCFWGLGACLLPLLAWSVPNWRQQAVACGATLLAMAPLFPFIPESPRWLLCQVRLSPVVIEFTWFGGALRCWWHPCCSTG